MTSTSMRLSVILALSGCGATRDKTPGSPDDSAPAVAGDDTDAGDTEPVDADGDGWSEDLDCNDADAAINPDALERCDGLDNDCDGLIDDQDSDLDQDSAGTWYLDADGDGYGDPSEELIACEAPEHTVADGSDCDDSRADVNPAGTETCDTEDDDCDGELDETCQAAPTGQLDLSFGVLYLSGGADTNFGFYLSSVGDMDGDGSGDAAIGGIATVDGAYRAGALWVVRGPVSTSSSLLPEAAALVGTLDRQAVGVFSSGTGDLDNDGLDDLLVGSAGTEEAAVLLGPASGTIAFSDADAVISGVGFSGRTLTGAGDLTGDGSPDVLVANPKFNDWTIECYYYCGEVRVHTWPLVGEVDREHADAILLGRLDAEEDYLGRSIAGLGDVNSDGINDLAALHGVGIALALWKMELLFGPLSGTHTAESIADGAVLADEDADVQPMDAATWSPALGETGADADGDGRADLLLTATDSHVSLAVLFTGDLGSDLLITTADAILTPEGADENVLGVAWAGDLDQDGFADLVIGSMYADAGGLADAGATYLIYGPITGSRSLADADAVLTGASEEAWSGWWSGVATAGELTGDAYPDLLIPAPGETLDGTADGVVYLVPGGPAP